jgi:NADH dehydrogenase FAD-containing subunit
MMQGTTDRDRTEPRERPRIVIGGGFSGVEVATSSR